MNYFSHNDNDDGLAMTEIRKMNQSRITTQLFTVTS